MICSSCAYAADVGSTQHGIRMCECPQSCTCQHGRPIEQDPSGNPEVPDYVDALSEAGRRAAYEVVGRKAPGLA